MKKRITVGGTCPQCEAQCCYHTMTYIHFLAAERDRLRAQLNQILAYVPTKHPEETDDDKVRRAVAMLESVLTFEDSGYMKRMDQ